MELKAIRQAVEANITNTKFREGLPNFKSVYETYDKAYATGSCKSCVANKIKILMDNTAETIFKSPEMSQVIKDFMPVVQNIEAVTTATQEPTPIIEVKTAEEKKANVTLEQKDIRTRDKLIAANFEKLSLTKIDFLKLLQDSRVKEFLETTRCSKEVLHTLAKVRDYGLTSDEALKAVTHLYNIVWSDDSVLNPLKNFLVTNKITSVRDGRKLQLVKIITAETAVDLENKLNEVALKYEIENVSSVQMQDSKLLAVLILK